MKMSVHKNEAFRKKYIFGNTLIIFLICTSCAIPCRAFLNGMTIHSSSLSRPLPTQSSVLNPSCDYLHLHKQHQKQHQHHQSAGTSISINMSLRKSNECLVKHRCKEISKLQMASMTDENDGPVPLREDEEFIAAIKEVKEAAKNVTASSVQLTSAVVSKGPGIFWRLFTTFVQKGIR